MRVLYWYAITFSLVLAGLPVMQSEARTKEDAGLHELSGIAGMLNEVE